MKDRLHQYIRATCHYHVRVKHCYGNTVKKVLIAYYDNTAKKALIAYFIGNKR